MSKLHSFSAVYRHLLYRLCRRSESGVLSSWTPCQVEDPTVEQTFGDIVHPCVRYIEEGFEGHQWWMAYTPYYGGNAELENPRLCYLDVYKGGATCGMEILLHYKREAERRVQFRSDLIVQ